MTSLEIATSLVEIARATSIRSSLESRFSDYCHECNNRLNSLKLSLYLAQRQSLGRSNSLLKTAAQRYENLEHQFDLFRAVCRPIKLSPIRLDLGLIIEDRREKWVHNLADKGIVLQFHPPVGSVDIELDAERMSQALNALVEWRGQCAASGTRVELCWARAANSQGVTSASLTWRESPPAHTRTTERDAGPQHSWARAIFIRLVTEHGCSVACLDHDNWELKIQWPELEPSRSS